MSQHLKKYWIHKNFAGEVFVKTDEFYKYQGALKNPCSLVWKNVSADSIDDAKDIGLLFLAKTELFSDLSLNKQLDIVKKYTNYISIEKSYLVYRKYKIHKGFNTISFNPWNKALSSFPCTDKLTIYVINHPIAIEKFNKIKNMREACE